MRICFHPQSNGMEIDKALEGFDFAGNGLTEGLGGGS
jgi:hypothetical protein